MHRAAGIDCSRVEHLTYFPSGDSLLPIDQVQVSGGSLAIGDKGDFPSVLKA